MKCRGENRGPYQSTNRKPLSKNTVLGRLRANEYRRLVQDFREARLSRLELQREAARKGGKISRLLRDHGANWWGYYDLSYSQHLALMSVGLGWGEKLKDIASAENPTREFLAFAAEDDNRDDNPFEGMDPADQAVFLNLLIGVFYSMESIGYYGLAIHELLARARDGDSDSLQKAVCIDRCVLATNTAAQIVASKQFEGDKRFFSGLFKRIKSPHAGRRQYIELRYFHRVLSEAGALADTPKEKLLDLVAGLDLYSTRGADPVKSLTTLFNDWER